MLWLKSILDFFRRRSKEPLVLDKTHGAHSIRNSPAIMMTDRAIVVSILSSSLAFCDIS